MVPPLFTCLCPCIVSVPLPPVLVMELIGERSTDPLAPLRKISPSAVEAIFALIETVPPYKATGPATVILLIW